MIPADKLAKRLLTTHGPSLACRKAGERVVRAHAKVQMFAMGVVLGASNNPARLAVIARQTREAQDRMLFWLQVSRFVGSAGGVS